MKKALTVILLISMLFATACTQPTSAPTQSPTPEVTLEPTPEPTAEPTLAPTVNPTPTDAPTPPPVDPTPTQKPFDKRLAQMRDIIERFSDETRLDITDEMIENGLLEAHIIKDAFSVDILRGNVGGIGSEISVAFDDNKELVLKYGDALQFTQRELYPESTDKYLYKLYAIESPRIYISETEYYYREFSDFTITEFYSWEREKDQVNMQMSVDVNISDETSGSKQHDQLLVLKVDAERNYYRTGTYRFDVVTEYEALQNVKRAIKDYFPLAGEKERIPITGELNGLEIESAYWGDAYRGFESDGRYYRLPTTYSSKINTMDWIALKNCHPFAITKYPQVFDGADVFGYDDGYVYVLFYAGSWYRTFSVDELSGAVLSGGTLRLSFKMRVQEAESEIKKYDILYEDTVVYLKIPKSTLACSIDDVMLQLDMTPSKKVGNWPSYVQSPLDIQREYIGEIVNNLSPDTRINYDTENNVDILLEAHVITEDFDISKMYDCKFKTRYVEGDIEYLMTSPLNYSYKELFDDGSYPRYYSLIIVRTQNRTLLDFEIVSSTLTVINTIEMDVKVTLSEYDESIGIKDTLILLVTEAEEDPSPYITTVYSRIKPIKDAAKAIASNQAENVKKIPISDNVTGLEIAEVYNVQGFDSVNRPAVLNNLTSIIKNNAEIFSVSQNALICDGAELYGKDDGYVYVFYYAGAGIEHEMFRLQELCEATMDNGILSLTFDTLVCSISGGCGNYFDVSQRGFIIIKIPKASLSEDILDTQLNIDITGKIKP